MEESRAGTAEPSVNYCRHCDRKTQSATEFLKVGGVSFEVVYCSECGIASSAFRLSGAGTREGPADSLMLRRLHKPTKK